MKKKQKAPFPVRLPDDVELKLTELMQKEGRSKHNSIITVLKKFFGLQ